VKLGLVAGLNRPGGNVTGVSSLYNVLVQKQLEVLHELLPKAATIGVLANADQSFSEIDSTNVQEAGHALGLSLVVQNARTASEIDAAFAILIQRQAGGLLVVSDAFFFDRREQLVALAARHALPAMYWDRDSVASGGLMSYGTSNSDAYRQVGIYTGKILKGAKPADLPVQRAVKVELVINLKTAKTLGLAFPLPLLGRADEVIE
jgi:putative ABC transport system substrate-binding protein